MTHEAEQIGSIQYALGSILEIIPDAVIVIDDAEQIMVFNRGAEEMFGYSFDEVQGKKLDVLMPPRYAHPHHHHVNEFADSGDQARYMSKRRNIWGRRKDGSEFPAMASISKAEHEGKRIYSVIMRDMTEHMAEEEARVQREKMEHEIQVARSIQAGFLPRQLPEFVGWDISAFFEPARDVAGDFYDAFTILQGRRLAIVIGDVVDKGVPAALFMALVRSLTRAFAQQNYSLSWADALRDDVLKPGPARPRGKPLPTTGSTSLRNAILLTNNYVMENHADLNYFATMFMGMLDPETGQLTYINAGHNPPFLVAADGVIKAKLKGTGLAVGMMAGVDWEMQSIQMEPGDVLYTYTDGVPEARDPASAMFTEKRLIELLNQPVDSARELTTRIAQNLLAWMDTAVQFDDITMLAIRRHPNESA